VGAVEKKLGRIADLVLVDGNRVPKGLLGRGRAIVKGDQKSLSIACASIFAKVHRDELMETLEAKYPGYGLSKHKGYPTPFHKEQIKVLGATPIHREGFRGVS
jgi:ribonuclease HII